jgi:VWFA-related protein
MGRIAAFLLVGFTFAAPARHGGQHADLPQQPTFRGVAGDLVVLPVTVTDTRGGLVADLTADRFVVYDKGRRQEILFFSNHQAPVSVAWVIDNSMSMRSRIQQVIAATMRFARLSRPDDELAVFEFNDEVRDLFRGRAGRAEDALDLEAGLLGLLPTGRTALYDALMSGLSRLDQTSRLRKALVLVSDGADNASQATLEDVLDRARRSEVTIYTIGLFDRNDPDANSGVLRNLATMTGGLRFLPRSPGPMLAAIEQIAREIRNAYTVSFVPPERDGAYHPVKVEIAGRDRRQFTVRTRPGYTASSARGTGEADRSQGTRGSK